MVLLIFAHPYMRMRVCEYMDGQICVVRHSFPLCGSLYIHTWYRAVESKFWGIKKPTISITDLVG